MSASSTSFESQFGMESGYSGADENVAEEIGGEEAGSGETSGGQEADPQEHQIMSNEGAGSKGEGAMDQDSESGTEADETSFETDTEWSPDDRSPIETSGDEALLDAYFAEAAVEEDAQEFLPILGALVPVFKAALPILVNTLAKKGSAALTARLRRLQQSRPRVLRRETGNGHGGMAEVDESEAEALLDALSAMEVVIGIDDRKRVTPTTAQPWRRICHLSIRAANGSSFLGTGFFIGPRTVATAGHCVFLRDNGGWASEIRVTPARDGSTTPFPTVRATSLRSVRGWVVGRKRVCDYGAIILPRTFRQPSIGAFGYAAYSDAMLRQSKLNLAGYPGDKPAGTMWYHGRLAKSVAQRVITYDVDTAGGQSGSPVWQRRGLTRTVVGIHTNGSPAGNSATRIIQPVKANFDAWRAEGATEAVTSSRAPARQRGSVSYGAANFEDDSHAAA